MDFKLILEGIAVLGAMGAIFGALLAFAAKIFYVEVDPKQEAVRACLAGANCGGCGYPGCDGYAAAVAAGKAPVNCWVAGGQAAAAQRRRNALSFIPSRFDHLPPRAEARLRAGRSRAESVS